MNDHHHVGDEWVAIGWLALCLLAVVGLDALAGWFTFGHHFAPAPIQHNARNQVMLSMCRDYFDKDTSVCTPADLGFNRYCDILPICEKQ